MGTSMHITFISYCQNAEQSKENRVGLHASSYVVVMRMELGELYFTSLKKSSLNYFMNLATTMIESLATRRVHSVYTHITQMQTR